MRKIAVITGTRAEYGLLRPILLKIIDDPELKLHLIVTGTHLSEEFGYTIKDIINDKIPIKTTINAFPLTDDGYGMTKAISKLIDGLTEEFSSDRPDIILILGDRGEPLAAAIAGIYSNIPIAHIHGGEVSGNVDEPVRHAISKLATIHFPAAQSSVKRLIKMGEPQNRIFLAGAPGLDTILQEKFLFCKELCDELDLDPNEDIVVVLQHPETTHYVPGQSTKQIRQTLEAVSRLETQTVVLYPNSDAGGREIISEIKKYEKNPQFRIIDSLPSHIYLSLLKHASILIGNSSSGIIEAPSFKLPVINIGERQYRREQAKNIINVDYNVDDIYNSAEQILANDEFRKTLEHISNPYGDGTASDIIVRILKKIEITQELLQKTITY